VSEVSKSIYMFCLRKRVLQSGISPGPAIGVHEYLSFVRTSRPLDPVRPFSVPRVVQCPSTAAIDLSCPPYTFPPLSCLTASDISFQSRSLACSRTVATSALWRRHEFLQRGKLHGISKRLIQACKTTEADASWNPRTYTQRLF
jgi:hypothetical protein